MDKNHAVIVQSFLFNGADFDTINDKFRICESLNIVKYTPGELILSSDNHTDALCFIESGKARITTNVGERETVIKYAVSGDVFGAATLFSSMKHNTKVYAETETSVIFLSKEAICTLIENSSIVALNYINFLSDRISFLNRKVAAFTASSAEIKLTMYLYGNMDENYCVSPQTSMSSLADQLGIGRASLYRVIDSLSASQMISYNGKQFKIQDMDALLKLINKSTI